MPFDPWRGFRLRLRRPVVRPGDNPLLVYADAYALPMLAGVLVVLVATLAVVLLASRSGGSSNRNRSLAVTSATRQPSGAGSRTGGTPPSATTMTIHGAALAGESNTPLSNPDVQVAVEGGSCQDYAVSAAGTTSGGTFSLELPGGCAPPGARIYFRIAGEDQPGAPPNQLEPACVSSDGGAFTGSLAYAPGDDRAVRLRPGCADQPSALVFVPGKSAPPPATDGGLSPALVIASEPGLPGGIPAADQYDLAAYTPGLPGGILVAAALGAPTSAAAAAGQPAPGQTVPTPPPPPLISGMPVPGATPQAGVAVVPPASAPAGQPQTGVPPGTTGTNGPVVVSPPSVSVPAPVITTPPIVAAPTATDGSAGTVPAPGVIGTLPATGATGVMTLDVTVVDAQGQPVVEPRAQVYFGGSLCADETAASKDAATVQLTLPGACAGLVAGAQLAFRAGGFDPNAGPTEGPVVQPLAVCSTDEAGTPLPVTFQPGASGIPVRLTVGTQGSVADCPQAPAAVTPAATGGMALSLSVRAADPADLFASPAVRVYAGGQQCGEASSSGSLVVHVAIAAGCGRPGDVLSFEAGGVDSHQEQPVPLAPACSFELLLGASPEGTPAYQPVTLAAGSERFVSLILAPLDGCPAPGTAVPPTPTPTPAAGATMTLTLSILDPALPQAPLERPAVTALVGGKPCARATSIDTQSVVLTLPPSCGAAGAPLSFAVSALDPRYTRSGDTPACAVAPPQPTDTAATYHPTPLPAAFQLGTTVAYSLLPSTSPCPGGAGGSPTPTASSTAIGTPKPGSTPVPATATPVVPASTPAAAPAATPVPQTTPAPPQAPTPTPSTPNVEPIPR